MKTYWNPECRLVITTHNDFALFAIVPPGQDPTFYGESSFTTHGLIHTPHGFARLIPEPTIPSNGPDEEAPNPEYDPSSGDSLNNQHIDREHQRPEPGASDPTGDSPGS